MVKIIEEREVPRDLVNCTNCLSLLEYGNADLSVDYEKERENQATALYASQLHSYCFRCPVCGCKVSASWIVKK